MEDTSFDKTWKLLYVEMLANPLINQTDKAFCAEFQIPSSTFELWKSKHRIKIFSEVQRKRKVYINEFRARAFKALGDKMGKDTNALKLAFQLMGDLVERTESTVEHRDHNEKVRRIENLLDTLGKRKKAWEKSGEPTFLVSESGTPPGEDTPPTGEDS